MVSGRREFSGLLYICLNVALGRVEHRLDDDRGVASDKEIFTDLYSAGFSCFHIDASEMDNPMLVSQYH